MMFDVIQRKRRRGFLKSVSLFIAVSFIVTSVVGPQAFAAPITLPAPTDIVPLSQSYSFPVLKGLKFDPANPFNIEFIIDTADQRKVTEEEASRLIKYFLAGLTIPEKDVWVNLSPYEQGKIINAKVGETDLGGDLLSQDYILKQLTSSLTYPESDSGKDYWTKVYSKVVEIAHTTNLPVNTFNKVWITPDKAEVYENGNSVFITEATLKTIMEEDYLALKENISDIQSQSNKTTLKEDLINQINKVSSTVMRDLILPKINQEVNSGKNFATLRQIYHSLILGIWFKQKFQDSIYKAYINQAKITGIDLSDKGAKDKVYNLYVEAFQKGVYNYIKQDTEPVTNKKIKRQYISGGFSLVPPMLNGQSQNSLILRHAGPEKLGPIQQAMVGGKRGASLTVTLSPIGNNIAGSGGITGTTGIGSSPMAIQKSLVFKNAYEPTEKLGGDINIKMTAVTAGVLTDKALRGKGARLDKKSPDYKAAKKLIDDESDGMAKRVFGEVANKEQVILVVRVSEGFGRDEVVESFKAGDVVIPDVLDSEVVAIGKSVENNDDSYTALSGKKYRIEYAIMDVIEGTSAFVTNLKNKPLDALKDSESGATSILITGPGVKSMVNCPDIYADIIVTMVPPEKRVEFTANPLDPELAARNPNTEIRNILNRIAGANGITLNDLEVVLMDRKRETERLNALKQLQQEFPGLQIVTITDGTVMHGLEATFGKQAKTKHKIIMTVGGKAEVAFNRAVASVFKEEGALSSTRLYSKNVNKTPEKADALDLANRYGFSSDEKAEIAKFYGPETAAQIFSGNKLYTQEDVVGHVEGAVSFITHNGVFGINGAEKRSDGNYDVTVLRLGKIDDKPLAWLEKSIVDPNKLELVSASSPVSPEVAKTKDYFEYVTFQNQQSTPTEKALALLGLVLLDAVGRQKAVSSFNSIIYAPRGSDKAKVAAHIGLVLLGEGDHLSQLEFFESNMEKYNGLFRGTETGLFEHLNSAGYDLVYKPDIADDYQNLSDNLQFYINTELTGKTQKENKTNKIEQRIINLIGSLPSENIASIAEIQNLKPDDKLQVKAVSDTERVAYLKSTIEKISGEIAGLKPRVNAPQIYWLRKGIDKLTERISFIEAKGSVSSPMRDLPDHLKVTASVHAGVLYNEYQKSVASLQQTASAMITGKTSAEEVKRIGDGLEHGLAALKAEYDQALAKLSASSPMTAEALTNLKREIRETLEPYANRDPKEYDVFVSQKTIDNIDTDPLTAIRLILDLTRNGLKRGIELDRALPAELTYPRSPRDGFDSGLRYWTDTFNRLYQAEIKARNGSLPTSTSSPMLATDKAVSMVQEKLRDGSLKWNSGIGGEGNVVQLYQLGGKEQGASVGFIAADRLIPEITRGAIKVQENQAMNGSLVFWTAEQPEYAVTLDELLDGFFAGTQRPTRAVLREATAKIASQVNWKYKNEPDFRSALKSAVEGLENPEAKAFYLTNLDNLRLAFDYRDTDTYNIINISGMVGLKSYDTGKVYVQKFREMIKDVANKTREEQLDYLKTLLQSPNFAIEIASWLEGAYYRGIGQEVPPFITKDMTPEQIKEKIAINLAGFYALETGVGLISEKTGLKPTTILDSIIDNSVSDDNKLILSRFANVSWKAGQPFRDLKRISRPNFVPAAQLPASELDKDIVQIREAALKVREAMDQLAQGIALSPIVPKATSSPMLPAKTINPGGIDLNGINVKTTPTSAPVSMPAIDINDFQGLTFTIVKLEEIRDISAALNMQAKPPKEAQQLALVR